MILPQKTHLKPRERLLDTKRRLVVTAIVLIITARFIGVTTGEESTNNRVSRVSDRLNVSSFLPPDGWIEWDFYGKPLYSPANDRDTRIAYSVEENEIEKGEKCVKGSGPEGEKAAPEDGDCTKGDGDEDPNADITSFRDRKLSEHKRTFSTSNYSLIEIEPVELRGYPGVMVVALGTESNRLFGGKSIWIVEYYTPTHTVSLTFFGSEEKFVEYKKAVDASFHSLIIY
jgi:hypothetical protein